MMDFFGELPLGAIKKTPSVKQLSGYYTISKYKTKFIEHFFRNVMAPKD